MMQALDAPSSQHGSDEGRAIYSTEQEARNPFHIDSMWCFPLNTSTLIQHNISARIVRGLLSLFFSI